MSKTVPLRCLSMVLLGCLALTPVKTRAAAGVSISVGLPGVQVPAEVVRGPGSGRVLSAHDAGALGDDDAEGVRAADGAEVAGAAGDREDTEAFITYRQPWTPPVASFRARVRSCDDPVPFTAVCMDDFAFSASGQAIRLRWWGVLTNTAQVGRPYYIAMYKDSNCTPATLIYKACVTPRVVAVQPDCTNQRVFRFDTPIPAVALSGGQRYWLQISENDAASSNPGADDFFWSGRRPVRKCRALTTTDYVTYVPLVDSCTGQPDDLSFEILLQTP